MKIKRRGPRSIIKYEKVVEGTIAVVRSGQIPSKEEDRIGIFHKEVENGPVSIEDIIIDRIQRNNQWAASKIWLKKSFLEK